jgi:hypothetical protein
VMMSRVEACDVGCERAQGRLLDPDKRPVQVFQGAIL